MASAKRNGEPFFFLAEHAYRQCPNVAPGGTYIQRFCGGRGGGLHIFSNLCTRAHWKCVGQLKGELREGRVGHLAQPDTKLTPFLVASPSIRVPGLFLLFGKSHFRLLPANQLRKSEALGILGFVWSVGIPFCQQADKCLVLQGPHVCYLYFSSFKTSRPFEFARGSPAGKPHVFIQQAPYREAPKGARLCAWQLVALDAPGAVSFRVSGLRDEGL